MLFIMSFEVFENVTGSFVFFRSTFSEFASKFGKDERFKAVEKMREREQLFSEFLGELKKVGSKPKVEHKQPSKSKAEKVRQGC